MKTLGNIIWHFPFLGFLSALLVYLFGVLFTMTVVAAPIGLGLMQYGKFLFWPFGNSMIDRSKIKAEQNEVWESYSTLIMIVYFPFGLIFAIFAIFQVIGLFLSIIGIPAALVVAKSLGTILNPVNKKCVPSYVLAEMDRQKAEDYLKKAFS